MAVSDTGMTNWLMQQLRPMGRAIAAGLGAAVISGILSTLDPLLMRRLIDKELAHGHLLASLLFVFGIVLCLLGSVLLLLWSMAFNFRVEQDLGQRIRIALLEQLNRMSAEFHDATPPGDSMLRLGGEVDQIAQLGGEIASAVVRSGVFFTINIAVMLYLNAVMTLAVLPSIFLFSFVQRRFTISLAARADSAQKQTGYAQSVLYEYVSNVPQIQLLCAEQLVVGKAAHAWQRMMDSRRTQKTGELAYAGSVNAAFLFTTLLVLSIGSYECLHGALTIGGLVAFYASQARIFEPVSTATDVFSRAQRVAASIRRIRDVLEAQPAVSDNGRDSVRIPLSSGFEIENVSYVYEGGRTALHGISLRLPASESVAIVGRSGSGKSTLARLLVRMYDPGSGCIFLNGHPLPHYRLAALRAAISYVPQSPVLFQGSLRDNLLYARASVSPSDLDHVIAITQLDCLLKRLPNGLDTDLGPGGHQLSGGELQRVALARALLRNAALLVLDEATSALDIPTEQKILQHLCNHGAGMLVIISHRLASLSWTNQIIVLDSGRIAAVGNHRRLFADVSLYRSLYESQSPFVTEGGSERWIN